MRIKELHEILQKNKNGKVTQNDIARAIGTSRANVSKLFSKNSYINDEKLEKIEKYFEIDLKSEQNGLVCIDYYPEIIASVENNKVKMSDKNVKCMVPSFLYTFKKDKEYIMCHADDDSMSPIILNKDFVIIEKNNGENIINNKIYSFLYNGNAYIKKLSKNINQIVVLSESKDYPTQYISNKDLENFYLIGEIVYIGRTLNKL